MICLCVLEIDPLSVTFQIFSSILWVAFFLMVSFSVQKLLNLIMSLFFGFDLYYSRRHVKKDIGAIYVNVLL